MIWLAKWEKLIVLHVQHAFCCNLIDVVCQTTTWNFHIWGSRDNAIPQQQIFHSLPLNENQSSQTSESALCLFFTTWPASNNRKTLDLTQRSILMCRFRCISRRSFLNSRICSPASTLRRFENSCGLTSFCWVAFLELIHIISFLTVAFSFMTLFIFTAASALIIGCGTKKRDTHQWQTSHVSCGHIENKPMT